MLCTHCRFEFYVPQEMLGQTVCCPNCTLPVTVNSHAILLPCPECQNPIDTDLWMIGGQATCPHCRNQIILSLGENSAVFCDELDFINNSTASEHLQTAAFQPGETIGKYRLIRCLGIGGMGEVYLAEHTLLNTRCAIKILHQELARKDPENRERLLREARLAGSISHPNLISVLDAEADADSPYSYIVMEYVDGVSLEKLLVCGAMQEARVIEIIIQTAEALQLASIHHIIHRDIKPANIMLATDGNAKLADLGIAKTDNENISMTLTMDNAVLGTPNYASPEQLRSSHHVDIRADIYSLGATMYHMLTGVRPFEADSVFGVMANVLETMPPKPTDYVKDISAETSELVMAMMAKKPQDRPQDFSELLLRLRRLRPACGSGGKSAWFKQLLAKFSKQPENHYYYPGMKKKDITMPVLISGTVLTLLLLGGLFAWRFTDKKTTPSAVKAAKPAPKLETVTPKQPAAKKKPAPALDIPQQPATSLAEALSDSIETVKKHSEPAPANTRTLVQRMGLASEIKDKLQEEIAVLQGKSALTGEEKFKLKILQQKLHFRNLQISSLTAQVIRRSQIVGAKQSKYDDPEAKALLNWLRAEVEKLSSTGNYIHNKEIYNSYPRFTAIKNKIDPNELLAILDSPYISTAVFIRFGKLLTEINADFSGMKNIENLWQISHYFMLITLQGAENIDGSGNMTDAPIFKAFKRRRPYHATIQELVFNNCRLDIYDSSGMMPLHLALRSSVPPYIISCMLNADAPLVAPANSHFKNILEWAANNEVNPDKFKLLIDYGVSCDPQLINKFPEPYRHIALNGLAVATSPAEPVTVGKSEQIRPYIKPRRVAKADIVTRLRYIAKDLINVEECLKALPENSRAGSILQKQYDFFLTQRALLRQQYAVAARWKDHYVQSNNSDSKNFIKFAQHWTKNKDANLTYKERTALNSFLPAFYSGRISPDLQIPLQRSPRGFITAMEFLLSYYPHTTNYFKYFVNRPANYNHINIQHHWLNLPLRHKVLNYGIENIDGLLLKELQSCVHEQNAEAIVQLIKLNSELNTVVHTVTPLHLAVKNGDITITKLLLLAGADPNIRDDRGETPYFDAVRFGHTEIRQILIDFGVERTIKNKKSQVADDCQRAGEIFTRLRSDSEKNPITDEELDFLIQNIGGINNAVLPDKHSLLTFAVKNSKSELLKQLLRRGAYVYNSWDRRNLVFMAIDNNDHKTLYLLLTHGAKLPAGFSFQLKKMVTTPGLLDVFMRSNALLTTYQYSMLINALAKNTDNLRIMQRLANKLTVTNSKDYYSKSLLHTAFEFSPELSYTLLVRQPQLSVNFIRKNDQSTLMHLAAKANHTNMIKVLARRNFTLVNAQDIYGRTPLHWAAMHSANAAYTELSNTGAKRSTRDSRGKRAADYKK